MHSLPFMSLFTRSASAVAVSPLGLPLAATTWANLTTISPLSQEAKAAEVMDTVRAAAAAAANSWVFIGGRSEEHTSELQSLMRISYAVFFLKKKKTSKNNSRYIYTTRQTHNT